jgi:uncharacterized iron-regulated membrane protein
MAVEKTPTGVERGRPGQRRPSGEPPPLPREDRWTRWVRALAAALLVGAGLNLLLLTAAAALGALLLTGLFVDSLRAGFG